MVARAKARRAARRAPARRGKVTKEEIRRALRREPLVGVKVASEILGITTSNFSRYRDRLEGIPVEGSGSRGTSDRRAGEVYFRSDVVALARALGRDVRD